MLGTGQRLPDVPLERLISRANSLRDEVETMREGEERTAKTVTLERLCRRITVRIDAGEPFYDTEGVRDDR